jgi:hypothetical protein
MVTQRDIARVAEGIGPPAKPLLRENSVSFRVRLRGSGSLSWNGSRRLVGTSFQPIHPGMLALNPPQMTLF